MSADLGAAKPGAMSPGMLYLARALIPSRYRTPCAEQSPHSVAVKGRRAAIALFAMGALLFTIACRSDQRCATCGMKIDPASPWVSYVMIGGKEEPFDTPSCAFAAWRKAGARVTGARFREYYSQELKPVGELRFVRGSDVVGPMGPDLVPVAAPTAGRFARDHNGAPPQTAEEIVQGEQEQAP